MTCAEKKNKLVTDARDERVAFPYYSIDVPKKTTYVSDTRQRPL